MQTLHPERVQKRELVGDGSEREFHTQRGNAILCAISERTSVLLAPSPAKELLTHKHRGHSTQVPGRLSDAVSNPKTKK